MTPANPSNNSNTPNGNKNVTQWAQYWAKDWVQGALGGLSVRASLYPLEVIKNNQQVSPKPISFVTVTDRIWKKQNLAGFYNGFGFTLFREVLKPAWRQPAVLYLPSFLEKKGMPTYMQQLVTGIAVATIDAGVNSPIEKWRVLLSIQKEKTFNWHKFFMKGWSGGFVYWQQQSVGWATFLIGQKYLRNTQNKGKDDIKQLSFLQLLNVSFRLTLFVSVIYLPFNTANTIKQGTNHSLLRRIYAKGELGSLALKEIPKALRHMYRGFPMNFASAFLRNVVMIFLIDRHETKDTSSV